MDIMENGDCTDKKHLAITGNDLKDIGFEPSPLYSEIFKDLLAKVIDGELENNKEDLLSYVKNHYIFRVKTIIEFENGKRYEISKQGKDFDSLETKLIDEVQKICANNMQSGEKIRFKVEYRELDFIVDEEIKEYIYP